WSDEIGRARADAEQLWADGDLLERECVLQWATMSGREFLEAYTHEFTVHAWDLAHATGGVKELDPALAAAALDWFGRNLPAEARAAGGAFGPATPVADDADVYTRLAGFVNQ